MGHVLVAGVGNVFLGDDGFGPAVVRRLVEVPLPDGVEVRDYGIGGIHLAYELLGGYATLVLVDAVSRGGPPGSVYVIEVRDGDVGDADLDSHSMDPVAVLAMVRRLGGTIPRTFVIGCEPADTGYGLGLSPTVARSLDAAVAATRDAAVAACQVDPVQGGR